MKLELEVKDDKLIFFMELIKNFSFVKVHPIKKSKDQFLTELKDSVDDLNRIKKGEKEARDIEELLDEL